MIYSHGFEHHSDRHCTSTHHLLEETDVWLQDLEWLLESFYTKNTGCFSFLCSMWPTGSPASYSRKEVNTERKSEWITKRRGKRCSYTSFKKSGPPSNFTNEFRVPDVQLFFWNALLPKSGITELPHIICCSIMSHRKIRKMMEFMDGIHGQNS